MRKMLGMIALCLFATPLLAEPLDEAMTLCAQHRHKAVVGPMNAAAAAALPWIYDSGFENCSSVDTQFKARADQRNSAAAKSLVDTVAKGNAP